MDLSQGLSLLASRIPTMIERLTTENATRNALLMPFFQALGYEVFDPAQVWQSYSPTGEPEAEVDCALLQNNKPALVATCKSAATPLTPALTHSLRAAFSQSGAEVGLLTNGLIYQFFLRDPSAAQFNGMSEVPTWTLDLTKLDASCEPLLHALCRTTWNPQALTTEAQRWQQSQEIERALLSLLHTPPADLLQNLSAHLGHAPEPHLRAALRRLRLIDKDSLRSSPSMSAVRGAAAVVSDSGDERLALLVVKGIACGIVNPSRLSLGSDHKGVPSVLLDDNPQKPIVSLQWSEGAHAVTLFGEGKRERKIPLLRVDDLLQYADFIVQTVRMYEADDHEGPVFRLSLSEKD